MKKSLLLVLLLGITTPIYADILLPPEKEAALRKHMEMGQKKCPKDKPVFDGENCRACDEPANIRTNQYGKCSEVCPNRKDTYECGPSCVLKDAPGPGYVHIECQGWQKKCPKSSLQGRDGKCYNCQQITYSMGIPISEKDCLSCPKTRYEDGLCFAKSCPPDQPIKYEGQCYPKCPANKPIFNFLAKECFSCSDPLFKKGNLPHNTDVTGCSKCKNKIHNFNCLDIGKNKR